MFNCFKDPFHVLMTVFLSTNDDDDGHEEAVVGHVDDHRNDVREVDAKEYECHIGGETLTLVSSLRKVDSKEGETKKKKVQWVDLMGIKELAEIREFQPSGDDIDSDGEKNCLCVIL